MVRMHVYVSYQRAETAGYSVSGLYMILAQGSDQRGFISDVSEYTAELSDRTPRF